MNTATIPKSFWQSWTSGELPLWQALAMQIVGSYLILFTLESMRPFFNAETLVWLKISLFPAFAMFSSICVFKASPPFKASIRGTIGKCWAVFFSIWAVLTANALYIHALQ